MLVCKAALGVTIHTDGTARNPRDPRQYAHTHVGAHGEWCDHHKYWIDPVLHSTCKGNIMPKRVPACEFRYHTLVVEPGSQLESTVDAEKRDVRRREVVCFTDRNRGCPAVHPFALVAVEYYGDFAVSTGGAPEEKPVSFEA